MSTVQLDSLPTSFGGLKPVGHALLALPSARSAGTVQSALEADGWQGDRLAVIDPADAARGLRAQLDQARGGIAEFGGEVPLMRRYLELADHGHHWLLVRIDDDAEAERVGRLARLYGAATAVRYHRLAMEELA